jgi:hypothetical protein
VAEALLEATAAGRRTGEQSEQTMRIGPAKAFAYPTAHVVKILTPSPARERLGI